MVKILSYWYRSQEYVVKLGNDISSGFNVTNGIKQGGLISPALYSVYTADLNKLLTEAKVGCHIVGQCVNHLSYADDLVLLSPSVKALQQLLNICSKYTKDFDIAFNPVKTKSMVFPPRAAP